MGSKGRGRPAKEFTEKERTQAVYMYMNGATQEQICKRLGVTDKTLNKHLGESLAEAKARLDAEVVGYLFRAIKNGCKTSTIFYLKCQVGWKDSQPEQQVEDKPAEVAKPTLTVEQWQELRQQILKG